MTENKTLRGKGGSLYSLNRKNVEWHSQVSIEKKKYFLVIFLACVVGLSQFDL